MIGFLLLLFGVLAITRPWWTGGVPAGTIVEVRGEVPRPGHHLVASPTVEAALTAAGLVGGPRDVREVVNGAQVHWDGERATVQPPSDPLLVGLPIDVDRADASAFEAIPGVGSSTAARIVADREARGPFRSVEDLERVPGLTREAVRNLRPFVVANGAATIDVNTASASRLELLDGVGPVLAARVVEYRLEHGAFGAIEELAQVSGVSSGLVERLRPYVSVTP